MGIFNVDFDATVQLWFIHSASAVYRLKKAYVSIIREILYNIVIEFRVPMKLVRLIKCV